MSTIAVTNLKHESASGNNITLDSSGNVGVGTTPSGAKLDLPFAGSSVAGLKMSDTNGGNLAAYAAFYNTSASQTAGIQNANNAGIHVNVGTGGSLCFGTGYTSANALDDYEEGTWTPQYVAASGSPTTGGSHGRYTKIGNLVTVHIIINGGPGTGSGELSISVPFTAVGYGGYGTGHTAINGQTWSWGTDSPKSAYAKNNTAVISFWDAGTNLIACSDMAASGNNIEFFLTYEAA